MKVKLIKHLLSGFHSVSSTDKWIEMIVEMPVCPQIGWTVMGERIKEIEYESYTIICYVFPDRIFYDRANRYQFTPDHVATPKEMNVLVNGYIAKGWTLK